MAAYTGQITRSELAITLGNVSKLSNGNLGSIYIGIKAGETEVRPDNTVAAIAANASVINFKASGFVLGGGEAFPMGNGGFLTLGLAVGAMKGQYDASSMNSNSITTFKSDGVSFFSYGIGYLYSIYPGINFSIDYKGQIYRYVYDSGLANEYKLKEKLGGFGATLAVKF